VRVNLDPSSRIAQSARTASRVVDGSAVVIVIDKQRLHTLNGVGTFVWSRAERAIGVGEIAAEVAREFEVAPEQATKDVIAFANELVQLGALEVVGSK
jgi:hypothetical protein